MFKSKDKKTSEKEDSDQKTAETKEAETAKAAEAPSPAPAAAEQKAPAEGKKEVKDDPAKQIEELKLKLDEAEKKRLLLLADMDNLRKRCVKDMEAARYNTMFDTVTPFLQVFDHFSMAVSASEKSDNMKVLVDGMRMIRSEFDKAFQELGVECVDATGKEFDPNFHEAVSQEASETVPQGKVIRQWSCGYKAGSRLLKPAMVVVSSGKPEAAKK